MMFWKLSLRNAKRQYRDYSLYFVTLSCSVSFMYAFNALIFSRSVKALSELEILPYMVVATSLLIIFVLSWIVRYMTNYMLKRRSKELSIYMVCGIPNRTISKLMFRENLMIGGIAFVLGLPAGVLLSQLLEATLRNVFKLEYTINFRFSIWAVGLTLIYFSVMFLYSLKKSGKRIQKTKLYDLLYYDRQNEKSLLRGSVSAIGMFLLSIAFCGAGLLFLGIQPLGSGYDILVGMALLVLFLIGFFLSVSAFLVVRFEKSSAWKYKKDRLVTFRAFTSKVQSMSMSMSILSVLFMLAIIFCGIGIAASTIANRNIELNAFDIMILHDGKMQDFSRYDESIRKNTTIQSSHTYGIYTGTRRDFLNVQEKVIAAIGRPRIFSYREFRNDTYMKQSDYSYLRKILGYEAVELDENTYYIHCVPSLEKYFERYMSQRGSYELEGDILTAGGVYSEPFTQSEAYGNGLNYIIIVPDELADKMNILYSLYAAITEAPLSSSTLQEITESCKGLVLLNRNIVQSKGDQGGTSIGDSGVNYLSGRWAQKETLATQFAFLICLFYLALILEIAGAAVLATQVVSDREKKQRQDDILRQLGMNERMIAKLNNHQLLLLFLLPVLPALIISVSLVYWGAENMQFISSLPLFTNNLWIFQAIGVSLLFFVSLYGIYYAAARISFERR